MPIQGSEDIMRDYISIFSLKSFHKTYSKPVCKSFGGERHSYIPRYKIAFKIHFVWNING